MAGSKNKNTGTPGAISQMPVAATGSIGTNEQVGVLRLNEVNNLGTDRDAIDALPDQGRVYAGKDANGVTINLRSLTAGSGIAISETPSTIRISVDSVLDGVISGARNTNTTGVGVYKDPPDGSNLVFRRLQGATGISVTPSADSQAVVIALANPDAFGDITGATNIGVNPSVGLYVNKTAGKLNFRSLASGSGKITLALGSSGRQIDLDINEVLINIANTSGILPASRVSGLAAVATSGSYVDLSNKPTIYSRIQDQLDYTGTAQENQLLRFVAGKWSPSTFVQQNAFAKLTVGANTITAGVPASELRFGSTTLTLAASPTGALVDFNLTPTGVTAGSYVNAGITVDVFGRITAAQTGTPSYIDPLTTAGDILFRNGANLTTRLPVGTLGQVLASTGTVPVWQTVPPSVASLAFGKGTGITLVGSSTTGAITATATLDNTAVAPGTYTAATITVDAQGRLTSAASTTPFAGTRKINTGTALTGGGDLTQDRTISLSDTNVVPGSYVAATITVDQQGRLTSAIATPVVTTVRKIIAGTGLSGGGDLSQDRTLSLVDVLTAAQAGRVNYPTYVTVDRSGRVIDIAAGSQPLTAANFSLRGDIVYGTGDSSSFGTLTLNGSDQGKYLRAGTTGVPGWDFIDGPALGMVANGDLVVGDFVTTANAATRRRVLTIGTTGQQLTVGSDGFPRWVTNSSASNTITITAGTGLTGGGDLTANRTISLANTSVIAGTYTAANITVDAQGRLTGASSSNVVLATRKVTATDGLTGGGDLTADRTIGMATLLTGTDVGVTNFPAAIQLDKYGRVTGVVAGAQPLTGEQYSLKGDLVFGYPEQGGFLTLSIDPANDIGKFMQVSVDGVPEWEVIPGPPLGYTGTGDLIVGDYVTNTTMARKLRRRRVPIGTPAQMLKVGTEGFPVWESNPSFVSLSSDPTTAQLPAGTYNVFKNTTTGRIATWVNDAGTLRSSTIYAP